MIAITKILMIKTIQKSDLLTAETLPNKYPNRSVLKPSAREIKMTLKPVPLDKIMGIANS